MTMANTDSEKEHTCASPRGEPSAPKKRGRARPVFSQADVTRAVKGVLKAKLGPIWRVRIETTGAILIEVGTPGVDTAERDGGNPWDQALADLEKRAKL
jgi:hypothetical protein